MGGAVKLIIDTDVGDDIDDAFALALAAKSPEVELLAVTTVYGRVDLRAKLASMVLAAHGRPDVAVAMGARRPLVSGGPPGAPCQAAAAESWEGRNIVKRHAVDLLLDVLRSEGDATVVTLGPLTNVALALLKDKEAFGRARLVVMGGCLSKPVAEYNIKCDPEAAAVVLSSGVPVTLVGLDVTMRCTMTDEMLKLLATRDSEGVRALRRLYELWRQRCRRRPILHDPLAVAVSFMPRLVRAEPMRVAVELRGEYTRGLTVRVSGEPNASVCVDVDSEAFLALFRERVLG